MGHAGAGGLGESWGTLTNLPEPETESAKAARLAEYGLAKYAQPTAEEIAKHKQKEVLHHEERQQQAKEQAQFEEHGKRTIDPSGFVAPQQVAPPPQKPEKMGGATGHQAELAQIMRRRQIQSAVPVQTAEVLEEGPEPPRQTKQPRDLSQMGRGALKPVRQRPFVSTQKPTSVARCTNLTKQSGQRAGRR